MVVIVAVVPSPVAAVVLLPANPPRIGDVEPVNICPTAFTPFNTVPALFCHS